MSVDLFEATVDGSGMRIAIVQSRFNQKICETLRTACLQELSRLGVAPDDILVFTVPGALEIPGALAKLAESNQFDALIALGAVIRGETYHFEVVADQSAAGIREVSLEFGVPIANAVLTTNTEDQAIVRSREKGAEAARVAVEMAEVYRVIDRLEDDDEPFET
jgi:6,7-dimethyl-8-ribityllumazine synthase